MTSVPPYFRREPIPALEVSEGREGRSQNRLAPEQALTHVFINTRAVPLARKRDAHQGRVFFLPGFNGCREGKAT